jgi:hypothetical protein
MPRRPRPDGVAMLGSGSAGGQKWPLEAPESARSPKTVPQAVLALSGLTERQFQAMVVAGLKQRGYLVWTVPDMRKTTRGLPDIIAVHPTRLPRRVLFWELKRVGGRIRPEQQAALAALSDVYGVDARVIRPADWLVESETV